MRAGVLRGDGVAVEGEPDGGDGAPADGFAVQEFGVVRGGLNGVTERVAEVEGGARAGFKLVLCDDARLDADACFNDVGEGCGVAGEDAVCVLLHVGEEGRIAEDGGLDTFLQAGAEFAFGEGAEGVGVCEDGDGLMEAADQVFASREIDAGLAADGAVDLGEEGGGKLQEAETAHVDRGEEAGDVAEDAAAQGDQEGVAVCAEGRELFAEAFDGAEAFVLFAGGDVEGVDGCGEEGADSVTPEIVDGGGGDEDDLRDGGVLPENGGEVREDAGADVHGVGGGGGLDVEDGHKLIIAVQRVRRVSESAFGHGAG